MGNRARLVSRRLALKTALAATSAMGVAGSAMAWLLGACSSSGSGSSGSCHYGLGYGYGYGYFNGHYGFGYGYGYGCVGPDGHLTYRRIDTPMIRRV